MIIMVYGAAACGKSAYAEDICVRFGGAGLYIATMRPDGDDASQRIARHRALREGKGFDTLEHFEDIGSLEIPAGYRNVLLESMGNIIADVLFLRQTPRDAAETAIPEAVARLAAQTNRLVVVCDDVFADGVGYPEGTNDYMGCMAAVNRRIAQMAQVVVEVVCGLPILRKGELPV